MVVLLNSFTVHPGKQSEFEEGFKITLAFMKKQKGLIRARLHRSLSDQTRYFNYAEWESKEDLDRASNNPEFAPMVERIKKTATFTPGLYEVVVDASV